MAACAEQPEGPALWARSTASSLGRLSTYTRSLFLVLLQAHNAGAGHVEPLDRLSRMSEFIGSVWWLIVSLGVLVTFHEFGHYWVARRCGVKVLRFSVGFG